MDRQVIARIVLYASVAALAILARSTPSIAYVARLALLVPAAFALAGATILFAPVLGTERAQGHKVPWRRILDTFEHSTLIAFADLMLLWTTASVAAMGLATMGPLAIAVFATAAPIGFVAALTDWFLGQETDRAQETWQQHPQ